MKYRSYEKEFLDKDDIPFADILTTVQELNVVNTFLGGHSITCKGVAFFLNRSAPGQSLTIAEIGSGGGDNLSTIHKFMERLKWPAQLIGVDIKPECIQYARQHNAGDITWLCSDYRTVVWPESKPDIIFSSLFCHHFTDEEMIAQLKWMKVNSRLGFFINDLHRHPVAYHSIKILTQLFSRSYLVKNDGPLSVKRSFKKKDWVRLFSEAGIAKYTIRWQWAFRFLICVPGEQR